MTSEVQRRPLPLPVASPRARAHVLGVLASAAVVAEGGAEFTRIWRLGAVAEGRDLAGRPRTRLDRMLRGLRILRDGYAVSRTRQNTLFNMQASFTLAFATTRAITLGIREHGALGPVRNVVVGDRHIHHFIPGGILSILAGGIAIAGPRDDLDKWLAIPFGIGVGLVLDESALLLQLEDVYWTEEGVLSLQIAFAAMALLAALAYLLQALRWRDGYAVETDWLAAARAWDDLQSLSEPQTRV